MKILLIVCSNYNILVMKIINLLLKLRYVVVQRIILIFIVNFTYIITVCMY